MNETPRQRGTDNRPRFLPAVGAACALLILAGGGTASFARPADTPRLSALRVTGGEAFYPDFDPGVRHYAVRCADGTTLRVNAQAERSDASLRLLRAGGTADGGTTTGAAAASVTVNEDHDVAIEVSDPRGVAGYHVHCIPPDFPDITIEARTDAVTDGLLLMTPSVRRAGRSFLAIVDNNGVPRWVMRPNVRARNFRRHAGHTGEVRYSFSERGADGTESTVILDSAFNRIDTATLAGDLAPEHTGGHDFLITDAGTYLLMSYHPAERDLSAFRCRDPDGSTRQCSAREPADDSVIQEVTPDGREVFLWNSWDHVKISDCTIHRFPNDYAHLNSLHELEGDLKGDIVVGLRGCAQVLRIERATGAAVWQMGGSLPMRADRPAPASGAARHLELVGDPEGEFCGQHHVTATATGSLLMFDNGNHCLGPRKGRPPVTRIVEYDISTGTEARFVREYRLPAVDGFAASGGGVTALENGNWLITWGNNGPRIAVSEVDTEGNEVFRLTMARNGEQYGTSRVYREAEADLSVPLNLP